MIVLTRLLYLLGLSCAFRQSQLSMINGMSLASLEG